MIAAEKMMMTAAVYLDGVIEVKTVARPRPEAGEVVLQLEAAAICATDLKIWRRGHRNIIPGSEAILGHELVGRVAEIGSGVDEGWLGKRVVVSPNIGCGVCSACREGWDSYCSRYKAYGVGLPGGLAEYIKIYAESVLRGHLIPVPEHIPTKIAVLAEAASCCYRGLRDCNLKAGETVLVMGAGPMGILSMASAVAMGASLVIAADPLEARRMNSMQFGANCALNPVEDCFEEAVREASRGRGADVVMVTAPLSAAQRQGISVAAIGGRINLFAGLAPDDKFDDFPANLVHYRGLKIVGSTGTTPGDMDAVVQLMAGGRLQQLQQAVTAEYSLSDVIKALEEAGSGKGLKVAIIPDRLSVA